MKPHVLGTIVTKARNKSPEASYAMHCVDWKDLQAVNYGPPVLHGEDGGKEGGKVRAMQLRFEPGITQHVGARNSQNENRLLSLRPSKWAD